MKGDSRKSKKSAAATRKGRVQRVVVPLDGTLAGQLCKRHAGETLYREICANFDYVSDGTIMATDHCVDYGPNGYCVTTPQIPSEHVGKFVHCIHACLQKRHNDALTDATANGK